MDSSQYLLPKYRRLKKEYDAVTQCNRCGFCETVCPTYVASGKETLSPRGRNQAFRQILEGKISPAESAQEIFSTCLTCHACTNVCFSQVPVGKLMAEARNIASENSAVRPLLFAVMRATLKHRVILSALLWTGFFFKRMGLSALLRRSGLLGLLSPELEAGDALVDRTPWTFGAEIPSRPRREEPGGAQHEDPGALKTAYFSGCGIHYLYPEASTSCARVLAKNSDAQFPNHSCCGLPAQSQGDLEGARMLARKNIDQFSRLGVDWIVVNDGSCAGIMKNYGDLLSDDPAAAAFSKKVKTFSEFLAEIQKLADSKSAEDARAATLAGTGTGAGARSGTDVPPGASVKVTYHDPCQVGNGQNIYSPVRNVLKSTPNIIFTEMEESNACCGGAGTYCLKHPRLAEDVLERKMEHIVQNGAEIVLTEASSCLLHIDYGIRMKGLKDKVKILHLGQFFDR